MTATWTGPPSPDLISVTTTRTDAAGVVAVSGEVDSSTAPLLTAAVDSLFAASASASVAPAEVVLDLCEVTFLDSAGLHALVAAHNRAGELGARMRVLVATRAVFRPLEVTGLLGVLGVEQVETGAA